MSRPILCAPRIWQKFSPKQKAAWRVLFQNFSYEWGNSAEKLTKKEREIIAANHATLGTWALVKEE